MVETDQPQAANNLKYSDYKRARTDRRENTDRSQFRFSVRTFGPRFVGESSMVHAAWYIEHAAWRIVAAGTVPAWIGTRNGFSVQFPILTWN